MYENCKELYQSIFQLEQFYWWRKPDYLEKITDMAASHRQNLSHEVVSSTPHYGQVSKLVTITEIGTDCISGHKLPHNRDQ